MRCRRWRRGRSGRARSWSPARCSRTSHGRRRQSGAPGDMPPAAGTIGSGSRGDVTPHRLGAAGAKERSGHRAGSGENLRSGADRPQRHHAAVGEADDVHAGGVDRHRSLHGMHHIDQVADVVAQRQGAADAGVPGPGSGDERRWPFLRCGLGAGSRARGAFRRWGRLVRRRDRGRGSEVGVAVLDRGGARRRRMARRRCDARRR